MAQETISTAVDPSRTFKLPDATRLGAPTLRIRDLQSTRAFYETNLGLQVKGRYQDSSDGLEILQLGFESECKGSAEPILELKHDPNAKRTPHNFAGLYHYAVLVPDRKSLASTYLAIENSGTEYEGFADHWASESLYLHDVERNGIEIYADRPRDRWQDLFRAFRLAAAGDVRQAVSLNQPLDFNSLLGELNKQEMTTPAHFTRGARIGHVHLRVTNLERSVKFYHEKLGFDITGNVPAIGTAFLSAGSYHHHIGLNTWHSRGGNAHERGEAGLENFVINLPDGTPLDQLAQQISSSVMSRDNKRLTAIDPDGIEIVVRVRKEV